MTRSILILLFCLTSIFAIARKTAIYRDIPYMPVNSSVFNEDRHVLDVYTPKVKNKSTEVVVFIHGGKWKLGSKDMFSYVGINFAEQGKTAVLINYRLTPNATYDEMAMDCAKAIEWVYSQIEYYGGDKSKIYICGHSSGGHLAALISTNNRFFDAIGINNPVKGCILIDAFAMNIYDYLKNPNPDDDWMYNTFTRDENKWKDASPAYFVNENSPKYMIFLGEKTKNAIYHDVKNFGDLLERKGITTHVNVMGKRKHMEMIGQMMDYRNEIYKKCITFMNCD